MTDKFTRSCTGCSRILPITEFYRQKTGPQGRRTRCKACCIVARLDYRRRHPEAESEVGRRWRQKNEGNLHRHRVRRKALEILGGRCVRCGFDDPRALQIDHINGGGHQERLASRGSVESRIVRGDVGPYQLLCANCNCIKRVENKEHTGLRGPYSQEVQSHHG